ncbi:serine/threonine protein kinase [Leptolyngbya cf. ectocarpi LEGE 11479]|uniref:Serine/threonine protein kinase n=1 Tax=Leptolyngbya cf. ectocarpi LEGE 11479 TaxID=1828722 RepID=A0A928X0Q7_LEPEC|nr:serine/threonine-protein kinase [Leptolyngbya ectocarpi]MBE9066817.1 serine/threonine protein kinase [Leptolyngbya cf. ectocarpi LEGE 11479]
MNKNVGRKLVNRYELMDSIGQGSMGSVYLAKDTLLGGVLVAVKFLAQTLLNEQMTQRFMHEAMTCAQLGNKSIHVVRVTDYGVTDDEIPFYVMEYLQGKNLGQVIHSRPLPVKRFRAFVRQICLGLEAAHKGIILNDQVVPIIHRDIKPSNILVTHSPSVGELVKILDFGIAKLMQAGDSDHTSTFLGTLAYASPEQMEGQELDHRSDIYSLGVMMYQMLTGSLPLRPRKMDSFGGWYDAHRNQDPTPLDDLSPYGPLPKQLKEAVMSCLAKEPSQRPSSVNQLLGHIQGFTLPAPPPAPPKPAAHPFFSKQAWPKDKPIAEIVFPQLLTMDKRQLPTLWVMLPPQEIEKRMGNTGYNNFLCTLYPHPMVLWITAFYSKSQGPRWLSSYLDLKKTSDQQFIWHLGENKNYHVLFFSKDSPNQFVNVRRLHIALPQQKLLKEWTMMARTTLSVGSPQTSKNMLKKELNDKLKPQMLW